MSEQASNPSRIISSPKGGGTVQGIGEPAPNQTTFGVLQKYWLLILAGLSFLIALTLVYWRKSIEDEIFKITYQFLLVVVIGGLLSYEYKRREQATASREAGRVLQREMLTKVIKAYGDAKKVRRLLRAKAIGRLGTSEAVVRKKPFQQQMELLMDIQLEFEALKHRAEHNPDLFPGKLATNLKIMESYLNNILEDYECKFKESTLPQPEPTLVLDKFLRVKEFTAFLSVKTEKEEKQSFAVNFQGPFHNTVKSLQELIIARDLSELQSR
jgi:hypothetical protein